MHFNKKEQFLNQHSCVIWMTGLSGAGKSTIASELDRELFERHFLTQILDGDHLRNGLNRSLDFSDEDRFENIRRVAEVSKLFMECGIICINSFITPTKRIRQMARQIIGERKLIEVYINAPLYLCEERETKGLYKKAREGLLKNFTGIDSPFEPPEHPDIILHTDQLSIEASTKKLLDFVLPQIR